jgi:hypothetical protein
MRDIFKFGNFYLKRKGKTDNELKGISFFSRNYLDIEIPKILFATSRTLLMTKVNFNNDWESLFESSESLFLNYIIKSRNFETKTSSAPFIIKKDSKRGFENYLDIFLTEIYPSLEEINVRGYPLHGDPSHENTGISAKGRLAMVDFENFSPNGQIPFEMAGFYSPLFIRKIKEKENIHLDQNFLNNVSNYLTKEEFRLFVPYLLRDIGVFSFYQDKRFKEDFSSKLEKILNSFS